MAEYHTIEQRQAAWNGIKQMIDKVMHLEYLKASGSTEYSEEAYRIACADLESQYKIITFNRLQS